MNHHKYTEASDPLVDAMRKAATWTEWEALAGYHFMLVQL